MSHQFALSDGSKLSLRPPTKEDIPRLYEAAEASRKELAPWMDWCHEDFSVVDAEKWVRETTDSETDYALMIEDEATKLCLGTCGLNDIHPKHRFANLGYWVRTSHTGRGIASAATLKVAEVAFAELDLVRVEIVAAVDNHVSQKVAQRAGATREGVLRNGLVHRGQPQDAVMFSLIPTDLGQD